MDCLVDKQTRRFPSGRIPYHRLSLAADTDNSGVVRKEKRSGNGSFVLPERDLLLARHRVPHSDGLILRAGDHTRAIGRKAARQHLARVAGERSSKLPRLRVPQSGLLRFVGLLSRRHVNEMNFGLGVRSTSAVSALIAAAAPLQADIILRCSGTKHGETAHHTNSRNPLQYPTSSNQTHEVSSGLGSVSRRLVSSISSNTPVLSAAFPSGGIPSLVAFSCSMMLCLHRSSAASFSPFVSNSSSRISNGRSNTVSGCCFATSRLSGLFSVIFVASQIGS